MTIPQDIRTYLEGLLQDADILTLDAESREEMIQELFAQLENYLTSVIVDSLQPDDLDTFIKMNNEKKSKEEIEQFVKTKLPNAQEVFTKAFVDFRNLYVKRVNETREKEENA